MGIGVDISRMPLGCGLPVVHCSRSVAWGSESPFPAASIASCCHATLGGGWDNEVFGRALLFSIPDINLFAYSQVLITTDPWGFGPIEACQWSKTDEIFKGAKKYICHFFCKCFHKDIDGFDEVPVKVGNFHSRDSCHDELTLKAAEKEEEGNDQACDSRGPLP